MVSPEPNGDAQAEAMSAMLFPMLFLIGMMVLLMFFPGFREALATGSGTFIEPVLPFHEQYFVPTVFILGSFIMVVNTIIHSFFMDPLRQAHYSHRSRQIGQKSREARIARDTATAEKMTKLQAEMLPEQMAMQAAMMKPMMFTMIFIIGIFSWMAISVENFRVGYVSTPWSESWSFDNKIFWIFPAWIATYISMSAPLGRIVDRHIKLFRYKTHPLVVSGETIPEPLLYLLEENRNTGSNNNSSRRNQRKRAGPRKTGNAENIVTRKSGNLYSSPPMSGTTCKSCHSDMIYRIPSGKLRCETCRFEWR
jgi:uncharacterized membrane protein (DUF106 family)